MKKSTEILKLIDNSPTAYHAVKNISDILIANGFTRLLEFEKWNIEEGGKYFVTRNSSSVIAFEVASKSSPFMICASHSDSPAFKAKDCVGGVYTRIAIERYGMMIMNSWFDRPLSLAGRAVVRSEGGIEERLFNIDRDLLVIPNVAPHLMRSVNDGFVPNAAQDLLPLFSVDGKITLSGAIARELSVKEEDIISHDTFVYVREKGKLIGADEDIILSPRLDDLECAYTSLMGFLDSEPSSATKVLAVFDNEEVGSATKQGAASTFLSDVLERISGDREVYLTSLGESFMVSADNAHAKHPAHPELSDPQSAPLLSGGVVIKHNANQKYTTDAISAAVFEQICKRAGVEVQHYANRADLPGGSTLGSIANTKVSVPSVDIGLAQLAMHSAVETASASDCEKMIKALSAFFSSSLEIKDNKIVIK